METEYSTDICESRVVPRAPSVYWLQGVTVLWMLIECATYVNL